MALGLILTIADGCYYPLLEDVIENFSGLIFTTEKGCYCPLLESCINRC